MLSNAQKRETIALKMLKLVLGIDMQDNVILKDNLDQLASENIVFSCISEFSVTNSIDYKISRNNEEASFKQHQVYI
jgi:hypothetical protein